MVHFDGCEILFDSFFSPVLIFILFFSSSSAACINRNFKMQFKSLSNTLNSIVSTFAQDDQEDEESNSMEELTLEPHQKIPGSFSCTSISYASSKRAHDDEGLSPGQKKRQRRSLDENEKARIMTFNRNSRSKVKETHSKSISFVKVKQINPPKIRAITKSQDGFQLGKSSNLENSFTGSESKRFSFDPNRISNRFLSANNAKSFQPFVMPFSTPFYGLQNSFISHKGMFLQNNQNLTYNHSLAFCRPSEFRVDHLPLSTNHATDQTKEEIIDDFLKDADPFQWTYPAPFQLGLQVKIVKKQLNQFIPCHNQDIEEGQTDND